MPHAGGRFTAAQREKRRALIAQLSLRYRTLPQVLEQLRAIDPVIGDISIHQAKKDLDRAREGWRKEYADAIQTQKAKELQELLELRKTAWECLQKTIGTHKTVTKEGKPGKVRGADGKEIDGISNAKVSIKEEELAGDPTWAARLIEIDREIRKLMGLDDPVKLQAEMFGRDGGPIETRNEHTIDYAAFTAAFAAVASGEPQPASLAAAPGDGARKSLDSGHVESAGVPIDKTGAVSDGALR